MDTCLRIRGPAAPGGVPVAAMCGRGRTAGGPGRYRLVHEGATVTVTWGS
jgi:hypothetical protein